MKEKTLLSDVIADVKDLKEMAQEMARNSIAESLTPTIQSLLSQKLAEDLNEEGDEEAVTPAADDAEYTQGDDESATPEDEGNMEEAFISKLKEAGLDESTIEAVTKALSEKKGEAPEETQEEEEVEKGEATKEGPVDEELDLDAILAEMEAGDKEDKAEVKENKDADADDAPAHDKKDDMEEGLDIDALLAEMEAEEDAATTDTEDSEASTSESAELEELRAQLQESNLLMAKLLYQNKLLSKGNLSESHKTTVIQALDKAKTPNEAKLIFETLQNLNVAPVAKQTPVSEALGFKKSAEKQAVEAEKKAILSEQALMFQSRAGLLKYK